MYGMSAARESGVLRFCAILHRYLTLECAHNITFNPAHKAKSQKAEFKGQESVAKRHWPLFSV